MKLAILTFLGVLAVTTAWCPNGCSGHGTCQRDAANKDSCLCFTRRESGSRYGVANVETAAWTGADCSLRTCPSGKAWAAAPNANNDHSAGIECSGRGICDRKAGVCQCFAGYWGEGCRRSACPNGCNGNGICQDQKHFAADYAVINGENAAVYASAWDATHTYGCLCDSGYRGPDCSLIECPSNVDPLGGNGNTKGRDCSGRGICDYGTGVCTCFKGYKGTHCSTQTTLN